MTDDYPISDDLRELLREDDPTDDLLLTDLTAGDRLRITYAMNIAAGAAMDYGDTETALRYAELIQSVMDATNDEMSLRISDAVGEFHHDQYHSDSSYDEYAIIPDTVDDETVDAMVSDLKHRTDAVISEMEDADFEDVVAALETMGDEVAEEYGVKIGGVQVVDLAESLREQGVIGEDEDPYPVLEELESVEVAGHVIPTDLLTDDDEDDPEEDD